MFLLYSQKNTIRFSGRNLKKYIEKNNARMSDMLWKERWKEA
jgi:hypothetical protein